MIMQTNRRSFLAGSALTLAGIMSGCSMEGPDQQPQKQTAHRYLEMLGVQLYTVRDLFEENAQGTLEELAKIGVKDCETAGLYDQSADDVRKMMDDLGLVSRAGHIRLQDLQDNFGVQLEQAATLGQSALYLAWIPEDERTIDKYKALANLLNIRGDEARAAGITLGYHNHEFEFIDQDGQSGYDILLNETDPELVTMELDFFWLAEAAVDPLHLFKKAPGRFTSCHIKDRTSAGDMAPVGDGVINFKTLLPLAEKAGIERFYVEHDNPEEPLVSVARSFSHLKG